VTGQRARWLGFAVLAFLLWLVVYPLALVVLESFRGPAGWTGTYFGRFVERPNEWKALWGSLWISGATVLLSAAIGVPLAFLFARYEFPGRQFLGAMVALPVVLPPLVGVIAFLFLFGETGFAARLVQLMLGTTDPPWRLQGAGAILLVHAYSMYVYFYLFTRAGLAGLDLSLLEAAAALGAGRRRTLLRVTLPLLRPALTGAAILTFMTSLASFSAPYIFGGGFRVMTTQIVATRLNGEVAMAMVETVSLTVVALVGLWLLRRTEGREVSGGRKGTGAVRTLMEPRTRMVLTAAAGLLTALLLLPHLTLVLLSFVPVGTWTTEPIPPAYTVKNYLALLSEPERFRPLFNSVWMATVAMLAAMVVAVLAGHLIVRRKAPGGRIIEWLLSVPWAVPGTVFAIALATMFAVSEPLAGRFILIGTLWLLPLAYLVRNLPMAGRAVVAGYRQLDPSLEEAAASLGAGRWRTLRRVTLPLLKPALAAGATLAFATGLGDFVTSIVLYTYDTRPISLEILSSLRQADIGVAAAYGVFLMVISAIVFALGAERKTAAG
jgi:iron(III) transport system permease protein